jgi:hypothetical protein
MVVAFANSIQTENQLLVIKVCNFSAHIWGAKMQLCVRGVVFITLVGSVRTGRVFRPGTGKTPEK